MTSGRFNDLDNRLDEQQEELASLQRTVEDNERTSRDQIGELEGKLEELESSIHDATRALSWLGDRMGWVERHIRASGGATEVDFDGHANELKPLVRKITQGQQAQAQLLNDADRRQLTAAVERFDQQAQRIDELTTAALQASTTLTETSYGEEEDTDAAKAFRAVVLSVDVGVVCSAMSTVRLCGTCRCSRIPTARASSGHTSAASSSRLLCR